MLEGGGADALICWQLGSFLQEQASKPQTENIRAEAAAFILALEAVGRGGGLEQASGLAFGPRRKNQPAEGCEGLGLKKKGRGTFKERMVSTGETKLKMEAEKCSFA